MENRTLTRTQMDNYATYLRTGERADATVEKYLRDVQAFARWLDGKPVTKEAVTQYKIFLSDQGQTSATVNTKLSAVNGLFRFLGWEEYRVKFLKVQRLAFRESSRELTLPEYQRLVETARSLGREWLALAMEAICGTGIRVSELRYITVEAVAIGRADVALKGKIRTILFPGKLARKLRKYAQKQKIVSGAIFCAEDRKPLSRFQIWRAMKSLYKEAGVKPSKIFPHNLRHLFATTFYRSTRDIVKLADVLGHSSINTTRIYLMTTGAEHIRCLDRMKLVS